MTRWWDVQIDKGIKLTKMRIKHMEHHGMGSSVIAEKTRLQKQERHKVVRSGKP